MKIGRITLVEHAVPGGNRDKNGPETERVIASIFEEETTFVRVLVDDNDADALRAALVRLCDEEKCPLVLTTGGTGPGRRDIVPEITRQVMERELPGFGEIMRQYSYERVRTALLSRATAGIRGECLVINLPGRPKPIGFCLKLVREAIAEALEQLSGARPVLRVDTIEIPLEKYLPFLKWLRAKTDPRDIKDPRKTF